MKDYLSYTETDLPIQLGPNYMARYSSLKAELACLHPVPRSDHRVLSFERSGPLHKDPSLKLSLL